MLKKYEISYQLEHISVLEKSFLRDVRFLQLNAKIQIFEHDWFDDLFRPGIRELLVAEDFLECIQSTSRLTNFDEF